MTCGGSDGVFGSRADPGTDRGRTATGVEPADSDLAGTDTEETLLIARSTGPNVFKEWQSDPHCTPCAGSEQFVKWGADGVGMSRADPGTDCGRITVGVVLVDIGVAGDDGEHVAIDT